MQRHAVGRELVSTMKFGITLRLAILGLAAGLMGVLIVAVTLNSQRQAQELRDRLNQVDFESLRLAEHFKDKLRATNDKMRRYATFAEAELWQEFRDASENLNLWISQQAYSVTTDRERGVLRKMTSAYEAYMQSAKELHRRMAAAKTTGASLAEYNSFFEQSRRLSDLGQELGRAHYGSRNLLLNQTDETLTKLHSSVLGLLALLFVFGVALAAAVYWNLIAPLKVRLVESQALAERQEKLASLGLLAAGVAHEVRNPLTAIKAALFMQQKRFSPGSPEKSEAEVVEREILRLERIVNNFLQFARPAEPELANIPAELPLQQVQKLFRAELAKADIQLIREESPPLQIKADPAQIQQVIINLVQNAADSIGRNGTIALRARQSRKRLSNVETDVVILEVSDTGKGIPSEIGKRLFDPFFTTKESGTGLGLSIAARIIEKHGGILQYQTQLNRGTTFGIVLPRAIA
jgi:signal transduction histidine kinase